MNQVPHITIAQVAAVYPAETTETHHDILTRCNSAIDAHNKANAEQEQYITAEEARKLGAGMAEYFQAGVWIPCDYDCSYLDNFKYRAIKQPAPEVPQYPSPYEKIEPVEPLKQVSLVDIPAGVALKQKNDTPLYLYHGFNSSCKPQLSNFGAEACNIFSVPFEELELAPASEQPWMFWGGGACPVPEGVTFEVTCRSGAVREQEEVSDWTHTVNIGDIIAYRITGLAEGWVLK